MIRNTSQKRFMKLARECYFIVCCTTILNDPELFGAKDLVGSFQPGDLEIMQSTCPELFSLTGFYFEGVPSLATATTMKACSSEAVSNPINFLRVYHDSCVNFKHTIYAWLSIPESKRVKQLSKGLYQRPGGLPPLEAAAELDSRVKRLEMKWIDKRLSN